MSEYDRSIYIPKSKADIVAEYSNVAHESEDYQKAKWGSHDSMYNRFLLGLEVIDWRSVQRWRDVGCGSGLFFSVVEEAGHSFEELSGIDITPELVQQADSRTLQSPARFECQDFETLGQDEYDLITMLGVLQQCGVSPQEAVKALSEQLASGGFLFLTTKHLGWEEFTSGRLTPEAGHSWFLHEDIVQAFEGAGIEVVLTGGFLPRENRRVTLEESHTMYFLGRKA